MQTRQVNLYFLVLIGVAAVVIAALGGGLFNQQAHWVSQWQHKAFFNFCHQIPERSLWINGQPMAVCSRCMGIYSGFLVGWLLLPLWSIAGFANGRPVKKIALAILLMNFFDIVGDVLGFWHNTLATRLVLGALMGVACALIFSGDFFNLKIEFKGNHHGRITEPGIRK